MDGTEQTLTALEDTLADLRDPRKSAKRATDMLRAALARVDAPPDIRAGVVREASTRILAADGDPQTVKQTVAWAEAELLRQTNDRRRHIEQEAERLRRYWHKAGADAGWEGREIEFLFAALEPGEEIAEVRFDHTQTSKARRLDRAALREANRPAAGFTGWRWHASFPAIKPPEEPLRQADLTGPQP